MHPHANRNDVDLTSIFEAVMAYCNDLFFLGRLHGIAYQGNKKPTARLLSMQLKLTTQGDIVFRTRQLSYNFSPKNRRP